MSSCVLALVLLTVLPHVGPMGGYQSLASVLLYTAGAFFAIVSATVVTSLTALASLECSATSADGGGDIDKGHALGKFRSRGQLGRALGPLVATAIYWVFGPSYTYGFGALGAAATAYKMSKFGRTGIKAKQATKKEL